MSKTIDNYRKMSEGQLNEKIREFKLRIAKTYSFLEKPQEKAENRSRFRREIAKIKTVMRERE